MRGGRENWRAYWFGLFSQVQKLSKTFGENIPTRVFLDFVIFQEKTSKITQVGSDEIVKIINNWIVFLSTKFTFLTNFELFAIIGFQSKFGIYYQLS